ncbi:DNA ligase [bacterium CPR1]|nr:DNA ligase [bacterium CPR1]
MGDLADGESIEVKGSAATPYVLRNVGGAYSCSCPAWRNQNRPPESRTCKHLKALRGAAAEEERLGSPPSPTATSSAASSTSEGKAPPLLLAHSWDNQTDLSGWWMSEKLDGVRAYWDGRQLWSRLGNPFLAPDWFLEGLPAVPLDGELWGGRRQFQRTVSIVRRQDRGPHWREIRFVVFDAPGETSGFEARQQLLAAQLQGSPEHLELHPQEPCRGLEHLKSELRRVEGLGGEGLMLRQPGSRYEVGRSHTLLKVKSFFDGEALVVGHQPGAGRHAGRLGALLVELVDGKRFSVGTGLSDAERHSPPPLGSLITFRYQELSNAGIPRFPSYVGVRTDLAELTPLQAVCCLCRAVMTVDSKSSVSIQLTHQGTEQAWQAHPQCWLSQLGLSQEQAT